MYHLQIRVSLLLPLLSQSFTPWYSCFFVTCLTNLTSPAATIKNKNEVIGLPCVNPLDDFISWVELPFTNTATVDDSIHIFIHPITTRKQQNSVGQKPTQST